MRILAALLAVLVIVGSSPLLATKLSPTTVSDPFSDNECPAYDILSYGSYIYNWPSKYDGVFWPVTRKQWIWFCPASGYASLGTDFEDLTQDSKDRIRAFLGKNYEPSTAPEDVLSRLHWIERIYQLRDKDNAFWAWFYRVMAYWHDEEGHREMAQEYRRLALPIIEEQANLVEGLDKIQNFFLAGEYNRRLGNPTKAQRYFEKAKTFKWFDEDGTEQTGYSYFNELIEERTALMSENEGRSPGRKKKP